MKTFNHNKIVWMILPVFVLIGIVLSGVALGAAQTPTMGTIENPPKVWITAGEPSEVVVKNRPPLEFLQKTPETANITVNYIGSWDAQAQAAFEYAVSVWETQITSPVQIVVEAEWANLGPGILGGAGAETLLRDFSGAPVAGTWYPVALANKMAGSDLYPSGPDIGAAFNSAFSSWYFGTDGNPPAGEYDFASVVLHEVGHGLGFFGTMSMGSNCGGSGIGCWGYGTNYPGIYDRFTENGDGTPLLNFPNYSTQLGTQLTSGSVFFDGPNANAANGNARVPLYAPGSWQQGSSYSHLAESFNGTVNALMTYSIGPGEVQHAPGPVMLGIFKDMGWTTGGGVVATSTPTPTKTFTPTPLPTCVPVTPATPAPTLTGADSQYLPLISRPITDCLPANVPTKTPTPTATSPSGWTNILSETFEGSFPGTWALIDSSGGAYQWGKRNCQVFEGSASGWAIGGGSAGQALGCDSLYPNDMDNLMFSPVFSLVGATDAEMIMKGWMNVEDGYDKLCIYASINNTNFYGDCYSEDTAGWQDFVLDLTNVYTLGDLRGQPNVWIAIRFMSDFIFNEAHGVYLDNIYIRKCTSGTCTTSAESIQPLHYQEQSEITR
jgi:hypothetical protein